MFSKRLLLIVCLHSTALLASESLLIDARKHSKQLAMELQSALKASMQTAGPVAAISVCHSQAPKISATLSQGNWQVGRTALKVRNPDNTADEWETGVLNQFAEQLAMGVDPTTLEASTLKSGQFRYMKAIPTGGVCLACHGESLSPAIKAKIAALYPADQAVGFQLGELRGAFTLTQKQ